MNTRIPVLRVVALLLSTGSAIACSPDTTGIDSARLVAELSNVPSSSEFVQGDLVQSDVSEPETSAQDLEDVVKQAFEDLVARRIQCGRDPASCDISRLAVEGSSVDRQLTELMADRVTAGITASDRGRATFRIESVDLESAGRVEVATCLHDDTVLVIDSAVYDDSVYSARSIWTLVEVEGQWLWSDERILEWVMEGDLCNES